MHGARKHASQATLASWGQLKLGTGPWQEAAVATLASQGHLETLRPDASPRAAGGWGQLSRGSQGCDP